MAKFQLQELSPLGATEARVDEFDGLTVAENITFELASLAQRRGKEKAFAAAAKKMLKVALPGPGKAKSEGQNMVFNSGAGQWFAEMAPLKSGDIASKLTKGFGASASITEQTGGWCRFDLQGENAISTMERICAVDFAMMKANDATRSVVEHIGVFILCRKSGTDFTIYGPRSSAGSLHHALTAAAKSAI